MWTEEAKQRQRERMLERYANETPEEKRLRSLKQIGKTKGRKHTPEAIQKIKEARAKQHQVFSNEARKHMSEAQKRYWKSLDKKTRQGKIDKFVNAPKAKTKDTKIELIIEQQLKRLGINYEKQKYCYNRVAKRGFYIDFYLPEFELLIECNGSYWHNLEKRKERDELLKERIENANRVKHNLKLLILWDYEIYSDKNLVYNKLKEMELL